MPDDTKNAPARNLRKSLFARRNRGSDSHDDGCGYIEGKGHASLLSSPFRRMGRLPNLPLLSATADLRGTRKGTPPRVSPSCAREETPESRGMPFLFLNTERGFGGKPPKKSGFRRHLAGSKMPKETFFTAISRWRWSRGARSMPRVFGRGSRSQPAALVSDRDDAALFPAIRILERYGSAKSGRARRVRAGSLGK